MKRCTRCVLPSTFPEVQFNQDGVCSVCTEHDLGHSQVGDPGRLLTAFQEHVETARAEDRRHHVLVAYSGGKDSTYLLYLLRREMGLRPLALTFDNGFLSPVSMENMRRVVTELGVEHLIVRYPQEQLDAIFRSSSLGKVYPEYLASFGSGVCISCIRMVMTSALRTAIEKDIPLVMLGNSPGQVLRSDSELLYQDNRIPFALRCALFAKVAERTGSWAYDWLMLSAKEYATRPFPTTISPLPILGYDEQQIYATIAGLGWIRPQDVDSTSTNCRLNAFGIVRHLNAYRFHPYDYEVSQLVRLGRLSREEALSRVEQPEERLLELAHSAERELVCRGCASHTGGC